MAFANDLFLISGATKKFFELINKVVTQFGAGLEESKKHELCDLVNMPLGNLLLKYLRLPLIATRLT